jgi:hypothetical protein
MFSFGFLPGVVFSQCSQRTRACGLYVVQVYRICACACVWLSPTRLFPNNNVINICYRMFASNKLRTTFPLGLHIRRTGLQDSKERLQDTISVLIETALNSLGKRLPDEEADELAENNAILVQRIIGKSLPRHSFSLLPTFWYV